MNYIYLPNSQTNNVDLSEINDPYIDINHPLNPLRLENTLFDLIITISVTQPTESIKFTKVNGFLLVI